MSEVFEVFEEHLKLLRRAYVRWEDCEHGAPAIDCKRPYGNSDVENDIGEILEEAPEGGEWGEDDFSESQRERFRQLHEQTETVLQIILATGEMRAGRYAKPDDWGKGWKPE